VGDAHNKLGILRAIEGDHAAAQDHFRHALEFDSHDIAANYFLAWTQLRQGDMAGARSQFALARELAPAWPKAAARLAWSLATDPDAANRNGALALLEAQVACESAAEPDPELFDALAAAYAELRRFDDATAAARRARELTPPESTRYRELSRRLELYERRQPFRDDAIHSSESGRQPDK